ncbi:unnamed protein product [Haemonchus placei]|uniref:RabBD domain-containing protein n=1 Tax=Haemonchus placei TaxID=6290 RepID=A0A158QL35_HAEPC|nr:unnamed protein product [Haemonchus placei]
MSIEESEQLFEILKELSPREQAIIRPVLERDLEFQRREKARLRQLKSYVEMAEVQPMVVRKRAPTSYPLTQSISSDSMISLGSSRSNKPRPTPNTPPARSCYHCHCRLGLIFNAGTRCAQCGRLLCNDCRRGTNRSKWLCHTCFAQRELRAASGEWVDGGACDPAEVSELLLAQLRRAALEKEKLEEQTHSVVHVRAPMISRRQLTLPTIATPSLLAVPSESDMMETQNDTEDDRFWGGSPSPRTPRKSVESLNSVKITAPSPPANSIHPGFNTREFVNSPSPRPSSPVTRTISNGNGRLPTTEIAPATPLSRSQCSTPGSPRTPTTCPKSHSRIPTISSDNLLQPIDTRPSSRRQSAAVDGNHITEKSCGAGGCRDDHYSGGRAHSAGQVHHQHQQHHQQLQQPRSSAQDYRASRSRIARDVVPGMRPNMPSSVSETNMWQGCQGAKPAPSAARSGPMKKPVDGPPPPSSSSSSGMRPTIDDYASRRARFRSQDNASSVSSSRGDRLDVISCDSRRSSGISLPSRSTSQDQRSYKGLHVTPASSRDSLSVASLATEVSTDCCTKSSVASQATCGSATTFLGEIQLILSYDILSACIKVHIIQCQSLPHFGNHKPNPYVKVILMPKDPDTGSVLKQKTTPRKGEVNPVFDQILQFTRICRSEVDQYSLKVSVWHKDLLSQNSPIGETVISLWDHDWDSPNPMWYQLEAKSVGQCLCDVIRSVCLAQGKQVLPDPCQWKMAKANVHIRLTFSLWDRERRIGPLSLLLRDAHFSEMPQALTAHRHATLVASARLYFNEKPMERRKSESRQFDQVESQWNWSTTFPKQNLNDLHLRSLKLKIKLQTGPFGYKTIGHVVFNDYEHRRG